MEVQMIITSNMAASNAIYNLQNAQTALNNLTELVTSGQNVNQPSDDPGAMNTLLSATDSINSLNQYSTNSTEGTTVLTTTSNALTGISSVISQAEELAGSISSGTSSTSDQQSAIEQLTTIKQQLIEYGNTQSGSNYVLGGTDTSTPPFSSSSNTYSGNSSQSEIEIAPNVNQSVSVDGSSVLLGTGSYGSTNILQTLDNLITAVGSNNVTGIQQGASDLEAAATQVNNAQVDVSARLTTISNMSTMNTNNLNTLQSVISNIQTVNTTKVGVELEQQQTGYSAALAATEQVSQLSLLNYM
jgi:flagellar hook-associated protein 3 FlgL